MTALHWHDDIAAEYVGPPVDERLVHFKWEPRPADPHGGTSAAAPRFPYRIHEPYRDAFRAVTRAMYEADLLRRQRLFAVVNRKTGERIDPLAAGVVDWQNYYPIGRPSLPELLAAYTFQLRLDADEVLGP